MSIESLGAGAGVQGLRFMATRAPWSFGQGVDLRMGFPGTESFVERLVATIVQRSAGTSMPIVMALDDEQTRNLMDELWGAGVRPSSGEGSVGQIGALTYHLDDMRRLVFKGKA